MKRKSLMRAILTGCGLLLCTPVAPAAPLYWDVDGATPGAGGASPSGTWSTGGTTWSTSSNGSVATPGVTTSLLDDLFFSAGVDATGPYTITLNDTQAAKSLVFQDGTATISGPGGVINLGGTGVIRVNNSLIGAPLTATIGNNTTTRIGGSAGLTKTGNGTLNLNGSQVHTFTGGLNVNGGTLNLNFANLATPTNLVDSTNALSIGDSGRLLITGKSTGTTDQTFGNVTVTSGGGQLLGNRNGGTALNLTLGSLTTTAKGGSLLIGTTVGGTSPVITTTTAADGTGIYGGRVVFSNGNANTGYDWTTSTGVGPYTMAAYTGYTALATSGINTNNSRITASLTLTGDVTTNSLKFENPASAQTLDLGGRTLTLSSGGMLFTGNAVAQGPRISNGNLTAGAGSNYDLIIHQYNATNTNGSAINNNTHIFAAITNNGANAVSLVKAGTGALILSGTNTFTGGIVVNDGGILGWRTNGTNALNNNSLTFNANTIVLAGNPATTNGGITINNGSQIEFRNNTQTFTVNGAVTGEGGGITLGQDGGGATRLNFNSTANNFTGPIRYAVTAQDGTLTVGSLADSTAIGEGNITFGLSNATVAHNFNYGSTANAPLVLDNRQFELTGTGNNQTASINNNSSQALTINTDLVSSLTGATTKNFTLGGTGAGLSTFAGAMPSGGTATINLVKNGTGTWVISGDNSYNGTTTISAGVLEVGGSGRLGNGNYAGNVAIASTSGGTFRYNSTSNQNLGGVISGAGALVKNNTGVLTLTNTNLYNGATTISGGTLAVNGTGSINNSAVTLNGGTFVYNSSVTHTNTFNFTSGTLGGTNLNGSLGGQTIGANQTISPGNSPGTAVTTSQTWAGGGDYLWEINNATGTAGADPGWDLINGSGNLDITALSGDPFTILVTSLTPSNTSGVVDNFDDLTSYEWLIADFASVTDFDEDSFDIDTSGFLNPFTGTFGISLGGVGIVPGDNSQIYLTYTAAASAVIPEPSTALLSALGVLALLRRKR